MNLAAALRGKHGLSTPWECWVWLCDCKSPDYPTLCRWTDDCSTARIRRLGILNLQTDDYLMMFAVVWYTVLCVALNQVASGGGSNLMDDDDIKNLTPKIHAERESGSKWVFVSEHSFLLAIWAMKSCMLVIYARITYVLPLLLPLLLCLNATWILTEHREGLRQRRWINYLAIYVGLGFVATELSLFLICRPLSNYWAVPTPDCMRETRNLRIWDMPLLTISRSMLELSILRNRPRLYIHLSGRFHAHNRHPSHDESTRTDQAKADPPRHLRHGNIRHCRRYPQQSLLPCPQTYFLCLHELVFPRGHRGHPSHQHPPRLVPPARRLPRTQELDWRFPTKHRRPLPVSSLDIQQGILRSAVDVRTTQSWRRRQHARLPPQCWVHTAEGHLGGQ